MKIHNDTADNFNALGTDCSCCHKFLEDDDPVFCDFDWVPAEEIPDIHFCSKICLRMYNLIVAIKDNIEPGDTLDRKNQPVVQLCFISEELDACSDIIENKGA